MRKPSEDKILYVLKSHGELTADKVGEKLEISTPGAQQQLARLQSIGLVDGEERKQARGRPRKYWFLTEKGHNRFPDRHSVLTIELIASTEEIFGKAGLEKLISHRENKTRAYYESEMADCTSISEKVQKLSELRSEEGYMASWTEEEAGVFRLTENHCPVCAAARICQGLCKSELEIFREALGKDIHVERTEHILEGARRCCYRITAGQ